MSVTMREVVTTVEVLDRNRVSVMHGTPVSPGANYATLTTAQTITGAKTFNAGALLTKGPVSAAGETFGLQLRRSADDGGSAGNSSNAIWFGNNAVRAYRDGNKLYLLAYDGLLVQGESAANPGIATLIVRGVASQTGDLTQWQDSAGAALGMFDANARLTVGGTAAFNAAGNFYARSAGRIGLGVRGAASQTADLFQAQDSAGLAAVRMIRPGNIAVGPDESAANLVLLTTNLGAADVGASLGLGGAYDTANAANRNIFATLVGRKENSGASSQRGYFAVFTNGTAYAERFRLSSDGAATFTNGAANGVALLIKGFTSQTADLQQWANVSGTALTIVDASGNAIVRKDRWGAGGAQVGGLNAPQGFFGIGASSVEVILAVRGVSGQTANLTEWQNSAGTALGNMTAGGKMRSKEFELLGADAGITLTTTGWQTNKVVSPGGTPTVFNFAQLTLGTAAIFYIANNHNSGINLYTVFVQYSTNGKMIAIQDANEPYSPANLTFALDNATGIVSVTASYSAGMWVKADVFFGTVTEL